MDKQPQLILIADKDTGLFYDKTASIASYQFCRDSCIICYTSAPNRPYNYARSRVQVLTLQQTLDGKDHLVFVDGKQLFDVEKILTLVHGCSCNSAVDQAAVTRMHRSY